MGRIAKLAAFLCAMIAAWVSTPASAADISTVSLRAQNAEDRDVQEECNFLLEGEIREGDAQKLAGLLSKEPEFLPAVDYGQLLVLCLNSTGGSFHEAIEISKLFQKSVRKFDIGTMIRKGDRCMSACSIVFMSGRYFAYEVGEYPWRYMHREATLAFHSPSLVFPESTYDKSMVELAYANALQSVSTIVEMLILQADFDGMRWMEPSLLARMLATPPTEFFHIEQVDHVGQWNIGIFPPVDFDPEKLDATTGCRNLLAWSRDESSPGGSAGNTGDLTVERTPPQSEGQPQGYKVTELAMWESGCRFETFREANGGDKYVHATPFTDIGDLKREVVLGHHFLDPRTLLRDIGTVREAEALVDKRECKVLTRAGKLIDSEICTYSATDPTGLRSLARTEFVWPSGNKTLLTYSNSDRLLINGSAATPVEMLDGYMCLSSRKTGNVFCYK